MQKTFLTHIDTSAGHRGQWAAVVRDVRKKKADEGKEEAKDGSVPCCERGRQLLEVKGEKFATIFNRLCDDGRSSTRLTKPVYIHLQVRPSGDSC
jgi:hypothetical protein